MLIPLLSVLKHGLIAASTDIIDDGANLIGELIVTDLLKTQKLDQLNLKISIFSVQGLNHLRFNFLCIGRMSGHFTLYFGK